MGLEALSIVLPVFNERDNLAPLQARLTETLARMGRDYEIVYVDDGSTDGSWDELRRLADGDSHVRLVRLRRNFGQTPAMAAGFAYSRHPIVVTLDADLQNDPRDIPRLLHKLGDAYDVVSGWRRHRNDPWLTRLLPSHVGNYLVRLFSGVPLHDFGCTLKAYRREVIDDVSLYGEMHRFLPVLASWVGGRVTELEVAHHPRTRGVSKYGLTRTFKVVVDLITLKFISDFSTRPNYIFGGFGLASLACGFLALDVVAYRVLVLQHLEATPLVFMMVLFFMTGILSLFIGFLAEIVIRGFHDTKQRPSYYVRETVGRERDG